MKPTAKQKSTAIFFDALAHPRRLMLLQILKECGPKGLPVHQLLKRTKLTPATLAFHLGKLQQGQVLTRKTKGCEVWFTVNRRPFSMLDSV